MKKLLHLAAITLSIACFSGTTIMTAATAATVHEAETADEPEVESAELNRAS